MPSLHLFASLELPITLFVSSSSAQVEQVPACPARHAAVLYAPETNLEQSEEDSLRSAKRSIDVAMYSFTDLRLADELVKLARAGVAVRVHRDAKEYEQEMRRGHSTTEVLVRRRVAVRVKSSQDLMHFRAMSSAAWSCELAQQTGHNRVYEGRITIFTTS
jgi:phosphatidylserine/phosphatidylglycerophosphate/cardiolipin synthase-like enzyme